ncbi:hypothetical protein BG910_06510 [Neisseria chenwenguii]|uniref:Uncharacterized protein n=2 Tax=Neisseria chenwenguii TaxID=1853278 RepID=A0A220S249_9NEIS|nr:hypothetical protein BG910_06510 [Neisseria chenwenguii]
MGISVENFMAGQTEQGRQSKLEPFKADILLLKKNGFSQKQIQQFLAQNGVRAGLTTINWFIRSRGQETVSAAVKVSKKSDDVNQLTIKPKPVAEPEQQPNDSEQPPLSQPRKFSWTATPPDDDELFGTNQTSEHSTKQENAV